MAQSHEYWLTQQDHHGSPRGWAPYSDNPNSYPVYRNVKDYGARNDATGDQAGVPGSEGPLQRALNDDGHGGSRWRRGLTYNPAVVFLPSGVYQIKHTLDLRLGTVIIGDPNNPPIIKAAPDFQGDTLINGQDSDHQETVFMILMKNITLDTSNIPKDRKFTALKWGVAQACGLTNVQINMPTNQSGDNGHTGISIAGGSTIAVTDVFIVGGLVGISNSNQQVNFKNISFKYCTTALSGTGGFQCLIQGAIFDTVGLCADISAGSPWSRLGGLVLLDCTARSSGPVVKFWPTQPQDGRRNGQFVIQNLSVITNQSPRPPIVIDGSGKSFLPSSDHIDTWVWGNKEPGVFVDGAPFSTKMSAQLLSNGKVFTKAQPTYRDISAGQVVNVKNVPGLLVQGNGSTDDSASLNAILRQNAANGKLTYFPFGVYIVEDTLYIPPGSRIVGEAWSVVSGKGSKFQDANNPRAVVKVGNQNEVGIAEISEMRFTVSEILPGAKIVEVNMSGQHAGDVGIWNCLVTVGGTRDSQVTNHCQNQDVTHSKAAFCCMHLTASSSTYIENFWAWTADHDADGGPPQIISTGRGLLVEATKGTWLTGTGFEHNWLYQYNFRNAANVFGGMLQTETPYNQGEGAVQTVPHPWVPNNTFGDPDFSWAGSDQKGRMALAVNVSGRCSNIFLYCGAHWAFFNGPWNEGKYGHNVDQVQKTMIRIADHPENLVWYSVGTTGAIEMISDGNSNPTQSHCPGGWGGQIAAYRTFARD